MNQEKIGKFIQRCRKEQGLTQEQLGEKLGVTYKAVSKWENARSLPDPSLYEELCGILNISLTELFNGDYIREEETREKADEVLYQQLEVNRRQNMLQLFGNIMQGIGVALLFVPIYKSFGETISACIVFGGFTLFVVGLCIKLRK